VDACPNPQQSVMALAGGSLQHSPCMPSAKHSLAMGLDDDKLDWSDEASTRAGSQSMLSDLSDCEESVSDEEQEVASAFGSSAGRGLHRVARCANLVELAALRTADEAVEAGSAQNEALVGKASGKGLHRVARCSDLVALGMYQEVAAEPEAPVREMPRRCLHRAARCTDLVALCAE